VYIGRDSQFKFTIFIGQKINADEEIKKVKDYIEKHDEKITSGNGDVNEGPDLIPEVQNTYPVFLLDIS